MTEDQIERIAERRMNQLDRLLLSGQLSQSDYDREVTILDKWGDQQYRDLAFAHFDNRGQE